MASLKKKDKWYVIKLGGSLIIPNGGANTEFVYKFNKFIRKKLNVGTRFFIICGGGATARHYRDAGRAIDPKITDFDLDWLGTHASRLNAQLLRTLFRGVCYQRVIKDYDIIDKKALDHKLIIAGGWKPGWSTDYDAVTLAVDYRVTDMVFCLSNIKAVYSKDPNKFKDAKIYSKMSWSKYLEIIGTKWSPGMNVPWDPVASQLAQKQDIKVVVCDGMDLDNFEKVLEGKKFKGTVIR